MNNMVEQSFQETIDYIKALDLKSHFSNLLDRYCGYYKKGIYVHFNFGSATDKDCFGHYVYRHDLDKTILDGMANKFKRNTRIQIHNTKDRLYKKNRLLQEESSEWRKVLRELENKLNDKATANITDRQYGGVQKALIALYNHYLDESKIAVKKTDNEIAAIGNMETRYKRVWQEFRHAETQILLLALEYYMKRLGDRLNSFFGDYKIVLRYSRKDILKSYTDKKEQHINSIPSYSDPEKEMTTFMRELFGFLNTAKKMFVINIYKDNEVYKLTASEHKDLFNVVIEKEGSECYDPFDRSILEPLREFLGKYEGLGLLINSYSDIKDKFGEESPAMKDIGQLIYLAYPREVLVRYDEIQREMVAKKEAQKDKRPKWISNEEAINKMVQTFAEFQFSYGTKDDENMNFMMNRFGSGKEKYYIHYIDEISNGTDVLRLAEAN